MGGRNHEVSTSSGKNLIPTKKLSITETHEYQTIIYEKLTQNQ